MTSKFQFTILGTGSGLGCPIIGCECDLCKSTDLRDHRLRTSGWLHNKDVSILFDCGPDFRQQCLIHSIPQINSILFTHEHFDHIGGVEEISPFAEKMEVYFFGNSRTLDYIKKRSFSIFPAPKSLHFQPVSEFFLSNEITFYPIQVNHGDIDIFGYRFGNTAYFTDAKNIPDSNLSLLNEIEILIVNSSGPNKSFAHFEYDENITFYFEDFCKTGLFDSF